MVTEGDSEVFCIYIKEIKLMLEQESGRSFPYNDLDKLQNDFRDLFKKYAKNETITADFNTYLMFVIGSATGNILQRFQDPLERQKAKIWLKKSFYEWFPKYNFLEKYDLSRYSSLNLDMQLAEKLRGKLIDVINLLESEECKAP